MSSELWTVVAAAASMVSAVAALATLFGAGEVLRAWMDERRWWRENFRLHVRNMHEDGVASMTMTFRGDGQRLITMLEVEAHAPGSALLHAIGKQKRFTMSFEAGTRGRLTLDKDYSTTGPAEWSFGASIPGAKDRSSRAALSVRAHIEEITAERRRKTIIVTSKEIDWTASAAAKKA